MRVAVAWLAVAGLSPTLVRPLVYRLVCTAKTVSRESICYKLAHPSDIKTFPTMTWNLDHGV